MIENPLTTSINAIAPENYFSSLIKVFFTALVIFAAVFFFFNLIMGGIDWMNSSGDKAKVEAARSRVINAVLGIIVVFGLSIFTNFLASVFGIDLFSFSFNQLAI